jgi:hypothetical protein
MSTTVQSFTAPLTFFMTTVPPIETRMHSRAVHTGSYMRTKRGAGQHRVLTGRLFLAHANLPIANPAALFDPRVLLAAMHAIMKITTTNSCIIHTTETHVQSRWLRNRLGFSDAAADHLPGL